MEKWITPGELINKGDKWNLAISVVKRERDRERGWAREKKVNSKRQVDRGRQDYVQINENERKKMEGVWEGVWKG